MPPRRRALLLAASENLALSVLRALGGAGYEVTIAGATHGRLLRLSRHCRAYVRLVGNEEELASPGSAILERLTRLAQGADLIVAADVPGALCAAQLRPLVPGTTFFPFTEPTTLRILDNKWLFYGFLTEHDLPTPRTWLIENAEQARMLSLPLVLKPLSGTGGRGVVVARDAVARGARLSQSGPVPGLPALAQEFIPGQDVSFTCLADRGRLLAWTVHVRRDGDSVEYFEDERVVAIGRSIAAASAYTGLCNIGMRYEGPDRARVLVIECNPRFWGTFDYTLGLGVDYFARGIALAEGRPAEPFERSPTGFCPGLIGTARRMSIAPVSRVYLRQKVRDPVPEVYKAVRLILGCSDNGP